MSTANSNSEWMKPIGCVHCRPVALREAVGELGRRLAVERRFERMRRRPPDFRRQVVAGLAERLQRHREQDAFADADRLRLEALLVGLRPEGGEVGRQHDAGDDLDIAALEGGDLRREIVGEVLVAAGIDQRKAVLGQHRREADIGIAPGIAVAVIGEQAADHLVGVELVPHVGEDGDHVLEAPEIVEGVLERLPAGGVAAGCPGGR